MFKSHFHQLGNHLSLCVHAQSCLALWDPLDCNPPDSPVHQARILEWVAYPYLQGIFPTQESNWGLLHWKWSHGVAQSCPGFSVHRIFQARVLEWVAISFSRGSSWPRDWTQVSCIAGRCFTLWATREADSLPAEPPGKPSLSLNVSYLKNRQS